jgi:hypothetical protein
MRYEPATTPSLGPQPGALALRDYAHSCGFGDAGIFNNRAVRGGSALSLHAEGRAVDITPAGGDLSAFCERLIAAHETLGVQQIIWQRRVWRCDRPGWRAYTGTDPHTSHAHVELTRHAAATLTVEAIASVLEDDMTPEQDALLRQVHRAIFAGLNPEADSIGYATLASSHVTQNVIPAKLDEILAAIRTVSAGSGASAAQIVDEIKARL